MLDIIRPEIWDDASIPVWYRENVVVFYNSKIDELSAKAEKALTKYNKRIVDVIHPDLFERRSKILVNPVFMFFHGVMYRLRRKE